MNKLDEILDNYRSETWNHGWNGDATEKAKQALLRYFEDREKLAELRGARNTDEHWIYEMNSQSEKSTEEWKQQIQHHKEWFDEELAKLIEDGLIVQGGQDE